MSPRTFTPLAIAIALLAPSPALAQQLTQHASAATEPAGNGAMILAGVTGAVGGMIAGFQLGRLVYEPAESCRECTRWGAAGGAFVGSTLGLALGVHLANHSHGDFLTVLGRTALVMGAGSVASYLSAHAGLELDLLFVPAMLAGGLVMAIHTERVTMPGPISAALLVADLQHR